MKILLASNTAWSIYNFRKELILHLINQGHQIHCLCPEGSHIDDLRFLGCEVHFVKFNPRGKNPLVETQVLLDFLFKIKSIKPDIAFFYTIKFVIYGSISCRLLKVKSISVITGLGRFINDNILFRAFIIKLYKFSLLRCRKVLTLNLDDYNFFKKYKIVKPNALELLPSEGINTSYFRRDSLPCLLVNKTDLQLNEGIRFLFCGRLLQSKGIFEFVEAARSIISKGLKASFFIVGFLDEKCDGSVKMSDLEKWQCEGLITFLGSYSDVREVISLMDCVVLPSYYPEGIPRIILEASSLEVPVITSNNVGCRDAVLDGVTGFICSPRDSISLSQKMRQIIELSQCDRERLGAAGRAFVSENFSIGIVLEAYDTLLAEES
jgi:glycosyltransferase involved in cell wall biosynthesis